MEPAGPHKDEVDRELARGRWLFKERPEGYWELEDGGARVRTFNSGFNYNAEDMVGSVAQLKVAVAATASAVSSLGAASGGQLGTPELDSAAQHVVDKWSRTLGQMVDKVDHLTAEMQSAVANYTDIEEAIVRSLTVVDEQ